MAGCQNPSGKQEDAVSYAHAEYHVTHASVSGKSDAIIATSLTQNAVKQAIRGRTDVNSRSASRS